MDKLVTSRIANSCGDRSREIPSERSVQTTFPPAQLAPSLVRALVDGRLPRGLGIKSLADLAPSCSEQARALRM